MEFKRDVWEGKAQEMAGQRKVLNRQRGEGGGPVWNQRTGFRKGTEVRWPEAAKGVREIGEGK